MSGTKGFTLIELLVVIGIIGILTTIVVVTFTTSSGGAGKSDSAKDTVLKTNLRNAGALIANQISANNKSVDGICGELRVKKLMDTILASADESDQYTTGKAIHNIDNTESGLSAATLTNLPSGIKVYTAGFDGNGNIVAATAANTGSHFGKSPAPSDPTYTMNVGCASYSSGSAKEWVVWGKLTETDSINTDANKIFCVDSHSSTGTHTITPNSKTAGLPKAYVNLERALCGNGAAGIGQ